MTERERSYQDAWSDYETALDSLAAEILAAAPAPGDGPLNGREWCEENDVPETMFAHAVEQAHDRLEWGVTPMHPWVISDE